MEKVLIVFAGKYDQGSAGAKRVRQFARGLIAAGVQVRVVGYRRGNSDSIAALHWDTDNWGVLYTSIGIKEGSILNPGVVWDLLSFSDRLAKRVVKVLDEWHFDRAILYGTNWFFMRRVVSVLAVRSVCTVADFNEWFMFRNRPFSEWLDQELFRRFCVRKLSGIIGITGFWKAYARRMKKSFLLIPAMGDDEFDNFVLRKPGVFNIVYVGSLLCRDLPLTMFEGLRLAAQRGVEFRFHIVGKISSDKYARRVVTLFKKDLLLKGRVVEHGWVSRERLLDLYSEASVFLLLHDNSFESMACAPTRLPEFLLSGVPVIVSRTRFLWPKLRHKQNVFILPFSNLSTKLADEIVELDRNPHLRTKIGHSGEFVAKENFNHFHHGVRLRSFLEIL